MNRWTEEWKFYPFSDVKQIGGTFSLNNNDNNNNDNDNDNNNNNNNKVLKNAFYNTWKSRCFLRYLPNLTINTVKKKSV